MDVHIDEALETAVLLELVTVVKVVETTDKFVGVGDVADDGIEVVLLGHES